MKENNGKEVMDEVVRQGVQSQPCPSVREKRKRLSKGIDLGSLSSRHREKKAQHMLSKSGVVKPSLLSSHPGALCLDSRC